MRNLTTEEFSEFSPGWRGKSSPFFIAIISLKKGEGLFITEKEWYIGKTPGRICRYLEKKFKVKYLCIRIPDSQSEGKGWRVKRVE